MKLIGKALELLPFLLLTVAVPMILFGWIASAEEAPPSVVMEAIEDIRENQKTISKNRDAHLRFMAAKNDNESKIEQLRAQCYDFRFDTMTASRIPDCTPSDLLE
jgi:hypothetical protein